MTSTSGMSMKERIVIAAIKSWNLRNAKRLKTRLKDRYSISILKDPEVLNYDEMKRIGPKYIFFPHWSWVIPKDIYTNFERVIFHMTDVPFGRGGSPLQNLILNKAYTLILGEGITSRDESPDRKKRQQELKELKKGHRESQSNIGACLQGCDMWRHSKVYGW